MTTAVDTVTGEIVPFSGAPLSPDQVKARALWVRDVTKAALTEGVDYGVIPGTEKPTLLKPGAEMLLLAAGLGFSITKMEDADSRAHEGVTYRCSVHRGELTVAECDGYAGYDESRYFISAENAERHERDLAKRYKRAPRTARFVEYRAPWNTLVKMAQKRALVGAALNAVAGSGLFVTGTDDASDPDAPPAPATEPDAPDAPAPDAPRAADSQLSGADAQADFSERLAALPEEKRTIFREWRREKRYGWPPRDEEVLAAMVAEVERLEAETTSEAESSGS
jgi:hypothetical protein